MSRDLTVRIRAEISDFQNKLRMAKQGVTDFNNELAKSSAKRQAINDLGTSFGKMGLLAGAGLGASAKAAMDWETAWAGVTKTVNGSGKELAVLEEQLRRMARTMPATHQEIAATAEAAGQLGVKTKDIASFTKVMIQLGETTNLSADEAATSIAQMANIMQTAPQDIDNLGATLVALGNNGASTERDIIQMAQNIAGAGKIVGLTEGEILAVSNALASVGIEAEAGGSSVSRIFMDMAKAVKTGSADLDVWSKTAGMSAQNFARTFTDSPAVAFDAFTKGLGQINREGGDVFTLLDSLGQSDIRVNRALLGMAGAGDLLSDSLKLQGEAWKEHAALTDEYAKRAETTQSKTQVAWNGIKDNAIDIGSTTLPVIKDLSDTVADLTGAFSELPKPVQEATGKALALTALLGGGVFVGSRVITGVANIRNTFDQLGTSMDKTRAKSIALRGGLAIGGIALGEFVKQTDETDEALGTFGGAISGAAMGAMFGPWGAAIGGAAGALQGFTGAQGAASDEVEALRRTLNQQTAAFTKATRASVAYKLETSGALAAAGRLGINRSELVDASMGDPRAQGNVNRQLDVAAQKPTVGDPLTNQHIADVAKVSRQMGKLASDTDKATASQRRLNQAVYGLKTTQIDKIVTSTKGISKSVAIKITTPGAPNAVGQTAKLLANTKATPKDVRVALKTAGWKNKDIEATVAQVDKLRRKPKTDQRVDVKGNAKTELKTILDQLTGIKSKEITVTTHYETTGNPPGPWMGGRVGDWAGHMGVGAMARLAAGGVVPGTSPSDPRRDNVLARDEQGRMLAVRSGEWIINERASRLNDRFLRAINAGLDMNRLLPGFAGGGRVAGRDEAAGPMVARLVNPTLRVEDNGLVRLIDTRVEVGVDRHANHQASRVRAGGRQ